MNCLLLHILPVPKYSSWLAEVKTTEEKPIPRISLLYNIATQIPVMSL
uniref:Uncharacterized protein n=1 Tax=Anguilla anguilla TaxID=7936 RepID=A0A0E9XL22_ANGAN